MKKDSEKKEEKKEIEKQESIQPEINIGLVGHVDHGKTTLTERLSGKWTDTHSEEIKRGITIRLGYADTLIRQCQKCEGTESYTTKEICPKCNSPTKILRKVSFVDAPGHESLMATMLAGTTITDGALLLIAANEECPQPQTREHLMALQITGMKNVIIVQNKVDLVTDEQALRNYEQIKAFLKGTEYENSPIIPVSAQHGANVDALVEAIEKYISTPKRDSKKEPMMYIARSFDINKPGTKPNDLVGGVLGGALVQGKFTVGDEIEIRPGRITQEVNQMVAKPVFTKITCLKTGGEDVKSVVPGGSIGVMTLLDPSVVKSDALSGNIAGHPGKLPKILYNLSLDVHLLERVVGLKDDLAVEPIKLGEPLMLNVNSAATVGIVVKLRKDGVECTLKLPVCGDVGARVVISRRVGQRYRLIGYGIIK